MSNQNYDNQNDLEAGGYSPRYVRTTGYTPPKSSGDSKNVPLPKGGSGASGSPSASSGQGGGKSETGAKK
jgi:hypothetical protein